MGGETDTSIVANPERNSVDVVGGNMFERSFSIETVLSVSGGRDNVKIEKKKKMNSIILLEFSGIILT